MLYLSALYLFRATFTFVLGRVLVLPNPKLSLFKFIILIYPLIIQKCF
jgi:hypothetical protein